LYTHPQFNRASFCAKKTIAKLCIATCNLGEMNPTNDARLAYEMFLGKRVSDSHWSQVKTRLSSQGLSVDNETVVFYAKVSKLIPRSAVGLDKVLEAYNRAERLLISPSKITGTQVLDIFAREGINPHPGTVSRWFRSVGGFRKNRSYLPEKLIPVLAKAFIYQTANTIKIGA
jgi:hypothetical protein